MRDVRLPGDPLVVKTVRLSSCVLPARWPGLAVLAIGLLLGSGAWAQCGNGICDVGEDPCTCPTDNCPHVNNDGCCSGRETPCDEPACPESCGDDCCTGGFEGDENPCNCPSDCAGMDECGDGCCSGDETKCDCPADCTEDVCGDCCRTGTETPESCPVCVDCPPVCGDDFCHPICESACTCPAECDDRCGDGCCTGAETECSCPEDDCPAVCGNGCCDVDETPDNCPVDCPGCGDDSCDEDEDCVNCAADCGPCLDGGSPGLAPPRDDGCACFFGSAQTTPLSFGLSSPIILTAAVLFLWVRALVRLRRGTLGLERSMPALGKTGYFGALGFLTLLAVLAWVV